MGWPNNFVQGVYDETGKVIGIDDGAGGQIGLAATYTWATKPLSSAYIGTAFISDISGGTYWVSNGTKWRPLNNSCVIHCLNSEPTKTNITTGPTSAAVTAADIVFTIPIKAGLWNDGDILVLHLVQHRITATGDALSTTMFIGSASGTLGTITGIVFGLASTEYRIPMRCHIKRVSATSIMILDSGTGSEGVSSLAPSDATITITGISNMDTTDNYLQFAAWRSSGATGTNGLLYKDTTLILNSCFS